MKRQDDGFALPLETYWTLPFLPGCATDWHVQYQKDGTFHVVRRSTREEAIEDACKLIDGGYKVFGLGTGPLTNSITISEIAEIYDLWVTAKSPFFVNSIRDQKTRKLTL